MSQELVLAVISVLGGVSGAKLLDLFGRRQEMNYDERRAVREDERQRIAVLEKRVDELIEQLAETQRQLAETHGRYVAAQEHVTRCERDLEDLNRRLEILERSDG